MKAEQTPLLHNIELVWQVFVEVAWLQTYGVLIH